MTRFSPVLFSFAAMASAAAQQVSMQPVLLSPLSATAVLGTTTNTDTSTAFPDNLLIGASAGTEYALAILRCSTAQSPTRIELSIEHEVVANTTGTPAAATCSTDLRLDASATAHTEVWLTIEVDFVGSPGVPQPVVWIDVDDDGYPEYQSGVPVPSAVPVWLNTPITPIRVRAITTTSVFGGGWLDLRVVMTPVQPTTLVTEQLAGCDGLADSLDASLTFDGGLMFSAKPMQLAPVVLVLGLGWQPVLLPPGGPSLPCLLLPSPDILVLMPPPPPVGHVTLTLPLPPAVRPVTFWAQGVRVMPQQLLLTGALRVEAH